MRNGHSHREAEDQHADTDERLKEERPADRKLRGALLSYGTWAHWLFTLGATVLFFAFLVALSLEGTAAPNHLLFIGLFTATIGIVAPGAGTPTGSVQFAIDGASSGSPVNVSSAGGRITASFSTASLVVGSAILGVFTFLP